VREPPPDRALPPGAWLQEGTLLTVPEALRLLPVGKSTIYDLIAAGEIEHLRVSSVGSRRGRVLVVRKSLEDYVERLRLRASPPTPARVDVDAIIARLGGGRR